MSRSTRRRFATPFVLTLATLPACVASPGSGSPPPRQTTYQTPGQAPPATNRPPQQGEPNYIAPGQPGYVPPATAQPNQPADQPGTIANPPRPTTAQPTQPTPKQPVDPGQTPVVVRDQPQPTQPGTIANPPRPTTPAQTQPKQPVNPGQAPVVVRDQPAQPAQPKQPVPPGKVDPQPSKDQPSVPTTGTAMPTVRHWNVRRAGATCTAMTNNACSFPNRKPGDPIPPCNPPPPQAVACPSGLADGAALTVVQPANDTSCYIDQPAPKCPPGKACPAPALTKTSCPR